MRACILLLTSCAWALQGPAAPGAPARPPAPVMEELLARWAIPVERYLSLPQREKDLVGDALAAGERERLRRLHAIERLRPSDWRGFVTEKGFLTPEGLAIVDREERLAPAPDVQALPSGLGDGGGRALSAEDLSRAQDLLARLFDGSGGAGPAKETRAGGGLEVDARLRDGTIASLSVADPSNGLGFEAGQLGVDGRTPLIAPSPYLNFSKSMESRLNDRLDYRVKAQVAYVDMRARFFADEPGSGAGLLLGAAERLGLDSVTSSYLRGQLSYEDGFKTQGLVVSSLLAQLSRAYNLYGPFDVAAAATSLTRTMHLAPNQSFDQSVGLRARLTDQGIFAGVFGGATENISLVGNHLFQDMLSGGVKGGFHMETAPHWTAALWGPVPAIDGAGFSVSAGQRYNEDTTVSHVELSLTADVLRVPMALRVKDSRETGAAIGFDRRRQGVQLEARLTPRARGFVSGEIESFRYGNAELDSSSVYAGVTIDLDGRPRGNGRAAITVEQSLASGYWPRGVVEPPPGFVQDAAKAAAAGLEAADRALRVARLLDAGAAAASLDTALNDLSLALSRLPPDASGALLARMGRLPLSDDQRRLLSDVMLRVVPRDTDAYARLAGSIQETLGSKGSDILAQAGDPRARAELLERLRTGVSEARALLRILSSAENWNDVVVSAGRTALLRELSKDRTINISLLDQSITFQTRAPAIIAAAAALNGRLSPPAPLAPADVEPWLLRQAGKEVGLGSDGASPERIAARLIELGRQRVRQAVDQRLIPAVDRLLASSSYDRAGAASAVLGALPPAAADMLRGRFGADLEGLLPESGASAEEVRRRLRELAARINDALAKELSGHLARAIGETASWLSELISHEINMAMIHMIIASEELDRLTVDKGRKASELGTDMLMSSFGRLDERRRAEESRRLAGMRPDAAYRRERDRAELIGRLTALGRERLSALQRDPSWPRGLRVSVEDSSWAPILASYGDAAFFELLGRIAEKRRARGKTEPLDISFEFRLPAPAGGIEVMRLEGGRRRVTLAPLDAGRRAASFLSGLEDALD